VLAIRTYLVDLMGMILNARLSCGYVPIDHA